MLVNIIYKSRVQKFYGDLSIILKPMNIIILFNNQCFIDSLKDKAYYQITCNIVFL